MKASWFQFSNPRIISLQYDENENFSTSEKIQMPIAVEKNVSRDPNETEAEVILRISVGSQDEKTPFFIILTMGASFRWEIDSFSEDDLKKLLEKNAAALLISYSRPIISMITSQSRFPAYNLPYLDLNSEN